MSVRILQCDVRAGLATLPDNSVDCIVTSPPYWGLRDYGYEGQIGMEPTLGEHIAVLVGIFEECRRVLKPEGTFWLNYGDCYASSPNGRNAAEIVGDDRIFRDKPFSTVQGSLKPKDLCMMSNRLAIALQDAGWWVRSEIVWHKPNPMPESIKDRPAGAHEKIWLLTKSQRYLYDADAVRVPAKESSLARWSQDIDAQSGSDRANGGKKTNGRMKAVGGAKKADKQRGHGRRHDGFNDRWDRMSREEQRANGANLKNVWTIATKPFSEAHFATFPPAIAETCIKAGCPVGGIVLDPFGGAGTTGLVADALERDALLIEMSPEYCAIAEKRIRDASPLFVDLKIEKPNSAMSPDTPGVVPGLPVNSPGVSASGAF